MPELPEVEFARQQLMHWLRGRKLRQVTAQAGTPLRQTTPRQLAAFGGHTLRNVERVGKHLALFFDGGRGLYVHLGMTGKLVRRKPGAEPPRFSKVCFRTASADVYLCDARRFGRVRALSDEALRGLPEIAALGPDAWRALPSAQALKGTFARVKRPLKVALLDQTLIAGLGNIHAVEALWRARLSPFARADGLTLAQVRALERAIHATLAYGLAQMGKVHGDTRYVEEGGANPFFVYGRAGQPCRHRDGGRIHRATQAQRSTYYCPLCQGGPARK